MLRTLAFVTWQWPLALLSGHWITAQAVGAASATAAAATATDEAPAAEVTVHGSRPPSDTGADRLRAQDARNIPGTFGEPLQAIESLPGVAPMVSGLPYFYVRGAPPADTGYYLDGIPLPTLFHIGPGPSVVPPAMLDHVEFFPSTAPVRYGRFVGGIIAGETTAPSPVARGEASVRLFDASAFVESPVDPATTALVAGRYGYPNLLLSIFAPTLSLEYGDYTVRVTRALGDADALSLFVIGAYDREEDSSENLIPIATQFHRIDVRYDHRWADGAVRVANTIGYDRSSDPSSTTAAETGTSMSDRLRLELDQRVGPRARLSAGADASTTRNSLEFAGFGEVRSSLTQIAGAYAALTLRPAPGIEIEPGVRLDAYRSSGKVTPAVDPKLAARIAILRDATWVSTFGVAHQQPTYVIPVPGLPSDPSAGLQTVYQVAEGVEARLPWSLSARLTAYYDANYDTSDFVSDCGTFASACASITRVDGRTYGAELLLQRPLSRRLGGWVSYTLSRAERRVGGVPYLSPFDRTHVLSAVLGYDFGANVHAGARGTFYTGRPDFPSFAFRDTQSTFSFGPGQIAQHRLPPFYRVDLRVDKRWPLGRGAWIAAMAEFFDVTLSKESVVFRCDVATGLCTAQQIGPIALPSVGIEAGF